MQWKHSSLDRALRSRDAWAARDLSWAQWLHRAARYQALVRVLVVVSRLGDGLFWYVLIAALALLGGTNGRDVAMQMILAGALNLLYDLGLPLLSVECLDDPQRSLIPPAAIAPASLAAQPPG